MCMYHNIFKTKVILANQINEESCSPIEVDGRASSFFIHNSVTLLNILNLLQD